MNNLNYLNLVKLVSNTGIPKYIIYFVTARCNAKCKMCFYWRQRDHANPASELTLVEIEKITQYLGNISIVSLTGGEPFLREDISKISQIFINNCSPKILEIATNAILTNKIESALRDLLPYSKKTIVEIQLSLDGLGEIHDKIRGVNGAFDKFLDTFQMLSELKKLYKNLKIKINCTVSENNEDSVINLSHFIHKKFNPDVFFISFPHGDSEDGELRFPSLKKFIELTRSFKKTIKLKNKWDPYRLLLLSLKMTYWDELFNLLLRRKDTGSFCRAGQRIIIIDESGQVFPCEPLWYKIGGLREVDYNIREIISSENMKLFKDRYLAKGNCHCTWGCVIMNSIIYRPSLYPRVLKNMVRLLLK